MCYNGYMVDTDRTLDWQGRYDPESRNYSAVEGIEDKPLRSRRWECDTVLDQGSEGACVGFGWSAELAAKPKVVAVNDAFALDLYHRAQQIDEWDGEDYSGTSVLAGAKAVMEHVNSKDNALIGEYRWAFGVEDVLRVVGHRGPVVLGITWYYNMYTPDGNNFIHASGEVVGGHCILLVGSELVALDNTQPLTIDNLDRENSRVILHNSWGTNWGNNGEAYLSLADLYVLLEDQQGEACIPMKRHRDI